MNTYRLTLKLCSPSGSLWQADTIFGHLCWLFRWRYGEKKLNEWLDRYRSRTSDPPLILSDGFPGNLLPRPLFLPPLELPKSDEDELRQATHRKKLKDLNWLTPEEFDRVRAGEVFRLSTNDEKLVSNPRVIFKNQISRSTGMTGDEGQLYPFVEHLWQTITVYARIDGNEVEIVRQLFDDMKSMGYGKDKSSGYGEIVECEWQDFKGFKPIEGANAFVSLSHFVPAQNDPTDGKWKINVKYGKLGGEWALPHPFKHPLLMLTPGSWFHTGNPDQEWYGRLVENISLAHSEVVQYGLAFAVPMRVL